MKIEQYDVVELLIDTQGFKKGDNGTVVEIIEDGKWYLIEFLDKDGKFINMISVESKDVKLLWQYSTHSYVK